MPTPDPDFTRFAETGDAAAFRAVVEAHLTMVHAVAWRQLGEHSHLAPDVAQGVFTRLARVARGLPREVVIAAWLHRQAVRLAIDSVRAETRRRTRETTAAMLHPSADDSHAPTPQWQQIAPLLDEVLDRLPEPERAALVLRYLEDRDFASVGTALKTTPEAARKRVARGLEKLRILLSRRGVAIPAAALSAGLLQAHSQAQFLALSTSQAATASGVFSLPSAAAITKSALASAAAGTGILIPFLMSQLTSATAGAALALLAAGLLYQHQEAEIQRRLASHQLHAAAAATEQRATPGRTARSPLGNHTDEDGPKTLAEIIDALEAITHGPDNRLARLRIAALLKKIPPADYLAFYTTAESRIPKARWRDLLDQCVAAWVDVDPAALTKALFASDNTKPETIRAGNLKGALSLNGLIKEGNLDGGISVRSDFGKTFPAWLSRDYEGALKWAESQRDTVLMNLPYKHPFGDVLLYSEFMRYAAEKQAADGSLETIRKFVPDSIFDTVSQTWADRQLADGELLSTLITPTTEPAEVRALCGRMAFRNPEELRAWVAASSTDSPQRFEGALELVRADEVEEPGEGAPHRLLTAAEIQERAEFALRNAEAIPRSEALRAIVEAWMEKWIAGTEPDFSRMLDWVKESGPPIDTADAIRAAATKLAESSLNTPMAINFAANIADSSQRGPLMRGLFLRWQDVNPQDAGKYLDTAPPAILQTLKSLTHSPQP